MVLTAATREVKGELFPEGLMQFTVNGNTYFLSFVPDEGRWFLFQATPPGIRRIPVIDDAALITGAILFAPTEPDEQRDLN